MLSFLFIDFVLVNILFNFTLNQGFGVEQLRDNNFETYWQSDGHLPHLVNIQFKVRIFFQQLEVV